MHDIAVQSASQAGACGDSDGADPDDIADPDALTPDENARQADRLTANAIKHIIAGIDMRRGKSVGHAEGVDVPLGSGWACPRQDLERALDLLARGQLDAANASAARSLQPEQAATYRELRSLLAFPREQQPREAQGLMSAWGYTWWRNFYTRSKDVARMRQDGPGEDGDQKPDVVKSVLADLRQANERIGTLEEALLAIMEGAR